MPSEEAKYNSPLTVITAVGRRDSGHLAVPLAARRPDAEPALNRRMRGDEAVGKPWKPGRMRASA
jgi:hypothetical protein